MAPERATHLLGAGALLGRRYRLERRIAAGGMATVWLALDEELRRPVAVKVLSDVLAEDPGYLARFRREARLAAGLSHPNLVRIFDFSAESERPYLVMEYVEAGTLADRISAGRMAEVEPRRLAEELLGALAKIHQAGVVHRDVKPSNVLLDGDGRARLTDFGIAEPRDATKLTQTGEVIGTLEYMAPEVREGEPATPRSDLYSCGVLLGHCLETGGAAELAALVERLTRARPAERPASAAEALALLETASTTVAATEPLQRTSSRPIRAGRELRITGRRALIALAALALGAVVVAIALGGGGEQSTPSNGAAHRTPSRTTTVTAPPPAATAPPAGRSSAPKPAPKAPPPKPKPKPPKGEKVPPGQAKKK